MADERYLECLHCGKRDAIEVTLTLRAKPGDSTPWYDDSYPVIDISSWLCSGCHAERDWSNELCFIGYPGITEEEKQEQLS